LDSATPGDVGTTNYANEPGRSHGDRRDAGWGDAGTGQDATSANGTQGSGTEGSGSQGSNDTDSRGNTYSNGDTGSEDGAGSESRRPGDSTQGNTTEGSQSGSSESVDVLDLWLDTRDEIEPPECTTDADCDDGNVCNGEERCREGACAPGTPVPNGEVCTGTTDELYLCRDGNCLKSRCGDGIVDERALEVCDDGNTERNDGCYDCRYSCETATDCNDSNICNGDERCDIATHTCVAGQPVEDGTTCGPEYVCWGGRCISVECGNGYVDANEECDDGNLEAGDGCGADCMFECKRDADCNDGNVCNGEETCDVELHVCVGGKPLDCDDGNPCTQDVCDELLGCFARLIDADGDGHAPSHLGQCGTDCDDEDPEVFTGAAELCDGKDNNCDGKVDEVAPIWYPDCDGDGFAAAGAVGVQRCEKPSVRAATCGSGLVGGWTSRSPAERADCLDSDPDVYPGQEQTRNTPIPGISGAGVDGAVLPFDYNCDGVEEKRWTTAQTPASLCILFLSSGQLCGGPSGWTGAKVPDCGESSAFTFCDGCTNKVEPRVQECR
jgi:cysteine-rich repeat protein